MDPFGIKLLAESSTSYILYIFLYELTEMSDLRVNNHSSVFLLLVTKKIFFPGTWFCRQPFSNSFYSSFLRALDPLIPQNVQTHLPYAAVFSLSFRACLVL